MTYRDALGHQQFESCKTSNKGEAEKRLVERRKEALEGVVPTAPIKPVSLEGLIARYLDYVSNQKGFRTKKYHVQHLFRVLGNPPIHTLNVEVLDRYRITRQQEGVGPATINREMATLKHALTKAVSWKLIKKTIREDLREMGKLKEPGGRLRFLSHEEAAELLEGCRGMFKTLVTVALHTGMRRGEILSLKWDAVDILHGFIQVSQSKNGQPRTIPMNDTVKRALTGLRTRVDVPWVFHDEEGKQLPNTRKRFELACKRAGIINFHFHDLRHTFASWLVMGGVPLPTVSELMGHQSIAMTMRYTHLSPKHRLGAVQSLDKNLTIEGSEGRIEGRGVMAV